MASDEGFAATSGGRGRSAGITGHNGVSEPAMRGGGSAQRVVLAFEERVVGKARKPMRNTTVAITLPSS
jgi:hypothetical protein